MSFFLFITENTPNVLVYLLLFSTLNLPISAINASDLLSPFPHLSEFSNLLISTGVAADVSARESLTILAVPNSLLRRPSDADIADAIRYHVLLECLSWSDLRIIPPNGRMVTTLFQTTGRAAANYGSINISVDPSSKSVIAHSLLSNATILVPIKTLPYQISIFSVDSLLIPPKFDVMASENRPSPTVNITKALIDGHEFNVAASMMAASGVASELEKLENGAGISIFMPTDAAFSDLPPSIRFQSLPADQKSMVLRFHVLHSYYPLGSLQSIVNPVQPTLATELNGAGTFTLNLSRVQGSVTLDSGIVQTTVTQTVFDENPVAIFGVSKVLLPREYFGDKASIKAPPPAAAVTTASSPQSSMIFPTHFLSPPNIEVLSSSSEDMAGGVISFTVVLGFIGLNIVL